MLQFITHTNDRYDYVSGARAALEGGCRWIQLRMKDAPDEEVIAAARVLRPLCTEAGAVFVLDDRVHLVAETGADGVHLGKNDMPVAEARRILGDKIIGATANTYDDMAAAVEAGADYIGLGPFRFTTTKARLSPVLGLEGYRDIMSRFRRLSQLPVVAIGGITPDDIQSIMQTGVTGIALSGTILGADDPAAQTANIIKLLNNNE